MHRQAIVNAARSVRAAPILIATLLTCVPATAGAQVIEPVGGGSAGTLRPIVVTEPKGGAGTRAEGGTVLKRGQIVIDDDTVIAELVEVQRADGSKERKVVTVDGLAPEHVTVRNQCQMDAFLTRLANENVISFGCYGFIGARLGRLSKAGIDEYLGGFRTAGAALLSMSGDEASLYSDLASDNLFLSAGLGYARMGFGAQVSKSEAAEAAQPTGEQKAGSTSQQLYQGGGNASVYLAIPAFYWRNIIEPYHGAPLKPIRRADLFLSLVGGADVPEMGGAVEGRALNARLGLQGTITQVTLGEVFSLYLHGDANVGLGNKQFFDNLDTKRRSVFGMVKGSAGIDVNNIVRIGLVTGTSTLPGVRMKPRLSIMLVPHAKSAATSENSADKVP